MGTKAATRTRPAGVIFDLDGVLIDSEPFWREGFRAAIGYLAGRFGHDTPELSDAFLVRYEGGRVSDTVAELARDLLPDVVEDTEELLAASDLAITTASTLFREDPRPIVDSVRAARQLAREGIVLGVASSSAEPFIRAALHTLDLRDLVSAVQSAYELERTKPDPAVYLKTLTAMNLTADQCVAVEDSIVGLQAALRAGLPTVWFCPDPDVPEPDLSGIPDRPTVRRVRRVSAQAVYQAAEGI